MERKAYETDEDATGDSLQRNERRVHYGRSKNDAMPNFIQEKDIDCTLQWHQTIVSRFPSLPKDITPTFLCISCAFLCVIFVYIHVHSYLFILILISFLHVYLLHCIYGIVEINVVEIEN